MVVLVHLLETRCLKTASSTAQWLLTRGMRGRVLLLRQQYTVLTDGKWLAQLHQNTVFNKMPVQSLHPQDLYII
jgi:hypothetical protein